MKEHEGWIFNVALEGGVEAGERRAVEEAVVRRPRHVHDVRLLHVAPVVEPGQGLDLPDRPHRHLRRNDDGSHVRAPDDPDVADGEGRVLQVLVR